MEENKEDLEAANECQDTIHKKQLREFLLDCSVESLRFGHLVFWYLIASIDDSESIQMSQHNKKELWDFL